MTKKNFWLELAKPFSILAPMEDVTDTVFRRLILDCGRPDVFFTEFTNCEGLQHPSGKSKVSHRLKYHPVETPLVAQIWGITPEDYYQSAKHILDQGFDGVDINMGCPVKKIVKQGACSALIKNHSLAQEIVEAVKEGVQNQIPVSIKTRIGFDKIDTHTWINFLLTSCQPDALTIHGRIAKELSQKPNNWEEIKKAIDLKNSLKSKTLIIINGDLQSVQEGQNKSMELGADGFMIGRGVFNNPWIFNSNFERDDNGDIFNLETKAKITPADRINLLKKHVQMWLEEWSEDSDTQNPKFQKNYAILRRFFKIYIQGFNGAGQLRAKLMETNLPTESLKIINQFKSKYLTETKEID